MSWEQDLDKLLDTLAIFPSKDSRFTALEYYISGLDEFIGMACDQTEVRLRARLQQEDDPISASEMESDLYELKSTGRNKFSSMICGSVLVSIYFAYESSLKTLFDVLAENQSLKRFNSFTSQKDRARGNEGFPGHARAYSDDILAITLFGKPTDQATLELMRELRNSYVHNGCSLDSLRADTKQHIVTGEYAGYLENTKSSWYITPNGVRHFFNEIHGALKFFERQAWGNM